jgi:hypothetical protein
VQLLHGLARTHASFDDPNLVSRAGLVPVMALAQRAGLPGLVAAHVRPGGPCGVNAVLKIPCLVAGMAARVILSFRVSQGCDLRRPVVDNVADGMFAARSLLFQRPGSLPDRIPADRWSPSARASCRRSRAFSSASCLLRSRAVASLARSDASVARWAAGMPPAEPAAFVF